MIIGFSGLAGVGKDSAAAVLVSEFGFGRMGLADPIKEICRTVLDFSEGQLYGPSWMRNEPDQRYPRTRDGATDYLTPREALQKLGTDWARSCYENVWIDLGLRRARSALAVGVPGVVFTDVRFPNEIAAFKAAGARVIRIKRETTLTGSAALHPSELEQLSIPDSEFDYVINNSGSLEALPSYVSAIMGDLGIKKTGA